jgi:hypothetical protein
LALIHRNVWEINKSMEVEAVKVFEVVEVVEEVEELFCSTSLKPP